jgi:hypothetical protein
MIGKVPFQQLQPVIDRPNQTGLACQLVEGAYGAAVNRSDSFGHLVLNVPCSEHRFGLLGPLSALKAFAQILFPFPQNSAILALHSKLLSLGFAVFADNAFYPIKTGVSSFLMDNYQSNHA